MSRVYEIYEQIFNTKQGDRSLPEFYSTLKGLWEQLLQHRLFTTDLAKQKEHWEEFMIATLLSGLNPSLSGFQDKIIASEKLPTASNAYSRLMRSTLGQSSTVTPMETSALVSSSGGRGGSRGGYRGGRSGGRRGGRSDNRRSNNTDDRRCDYCSRTGHLEDYCWKKWGNPGFAHQASENTSIQTSAPGSICSGSTSSASDIHDRPSWVNELL